MTVKVQPQKAAELSREIARLRKTAVWRAAMKDPTVGKELKSIAAIAVKAASDTELGFEEKKLAVVECAGAIAMVGESRRTYSAVMSGVQDGVKELKKTLAGTALEHDEEVIEALENARRSVLLGSRCRNAGGAGKKANARERELLAAEYMYGEYCRLNGVPNDEADGPLVFEWIRNRMGNFHYSETRNELEARIKNDIEKRD